jgi:hypothetical protein
MNITIDDEWEEFMTSAVDNDSSEYSDNELNISVDENNEIIAANINDELNCMNPPESSKIYISTKTKIDYLNKPIDLKKIFIKNKITYR